MKSRKIVFNETEIYLLDHDKEDFISLTDIAKIKNPQAPADIIKNWMRNKNTIELLGIWERLNNPEFKLVEFDQFRNEAGYNHFVLSPQKKLKNFAYPEHPCSEYIPAYDFRHHFSGTFHRSNKI